MSQYRSEVQFFRTRSHTLRPWFVAIVSFLVIACAGVFTGLPNLLLIPMSDEFGDGYGDVSIAVSVNVFLYGLTAPFATSLMDRVGVRRVTLGALAMIASGAILTVLATTSWHVILTWGVLVGLGSGSIAMAFGAVVADRWFARHKGVVTGALSSATMFGGMVLLPLLAPIVSMSGWRSLLLLVVILVCVVGLLVSLVLRDFPSDLAIPPYGARDVLPRPSPMTGSVRRALHSLVRASRPGKFLIVAGSFGICGASTNGVMMSHFVPAAHDHGMNSTAASGLLAGMGIANVFGTVLAGFLTDRMDPAVLLSFVYMFRSGTFFILPGSFDSSVTGALVFCSVTFGLLDLATVPPTIKLCREFFSSDGAIVFAWVNAAHQVGAGAATVSAGFARDRLLSYESVWLTLALLCIAAGLACLFLRRPSIASL